LKLLKEGSDTRGKGLIWIIQCLQDLEVIIQKEMMPDFIDNDSKDFIMSLAQKDYQLGQLRLDLTRAKLQARHLLSPLKLQKLSI